MKLFSQKIGMAIPILFILCLTVTSCDFEFVLPEANSIADKTLRTAGFSYSQTNPDDFREVTFTNESGSATDYSWDFAGLASSSDSDPSYVFEAGEGTYTVTLVVSDKNGESDTFTKEVNVIEPEEPDAIVPEVFNGDFTEGQDGWKVSSFTDGTTSPYNSSSDGSNLDYDGNDTVKQNMYWK